jgi:TPR repeat protein
MVSVANAVAFMRSQCNNITCAALVLIACVTVHAADADVERALAAVRARAVAGELVAQFSLGELLYYGSTDTQPAVEWFRKAAAQGYAPAEFQLAQLYDFGFIVAQSDAEALAWYRKAAEHGSAAGCRQVGEFYRRGRAVAADPAEAARWYRLGAERDDLRAQVQLGQMYLDGSGVPRDNRIAYLWFSVAAQQTPLVDNYKALIEFRNIAAARMTPEDEAAAAASVAAWKPQAGSPLSP